MNPGVHRHLREVRFGDCDPAGIVYFPCFFHFFHEAMETWFGACLGQSYADVIRERRIGFPAVHTEADFRVPSRFGERLEIELRVASIGTSSLRLEYAVRRHGESDVVRLTGHSVVVVLDLDPGRASYMRSLPIPDDLRAAIQVFAGL